MDDSTSGAYVLTNPNATVDYLAALTLTATSVGSQLSKTDLKDQIEGMLATIKGGANIKSFSPSKTAERTLMDNAGIYANYTAVLEDGTQIHPACLFMALGAAKGSDLARKLGIRLEDERIIVNEQMDTGLPGVFAAGDCIGGILQVSVAVGEGAKAALSCIKYLRS